MTMKIEAIEAIEALEVLLNEILIPPSHQLKAAQSLAAVPAVCRPECSGECSGLVMTADT